MPPLSWVALAAGDALPDRSPRLGMQLKSLSAAAWAAIDELRCAAWRGLLAGDTCAGSSSVFRTPCFGRAAAAARESSLHKPY